MMKYGFLTGFMYHVGTCVGEFLQDEEKKSFAPMTLPEIVKDYVCHSNFLDRFFLRRNIRQYIKNNLTSDRLEYAYPFEYDLAFPEDYFEGDLHVFLTNVLSLLDSERKSRVRKFFSR